MIRRLLTLNNSDINDRTPTCRRKALQIANHADHSSLHLDWARWHRHVRHSIHQPTHRHRNLHRHPTRTSPAACAAAVAHAPAAAPASVSCLSPASCLDLNISQLINSHAFEISCSHTLHVLYVNIYIYRYLCIRSNARRPSNTMP